MTLHINTQFQKCLFNKPVMVAECLQELSEIQAYAAAEYYMRNKTCEERTMEQPQMPVPVLRMV